MLYLSFLKKKTLNKQQKQNMIVKNLIGGFRSKFFPSGPEAVNKRRETYRVKAKLQTREMSTQVRFTDKVSQAVFNTSTGSTKRCIDNKYH